MKGIIVKGSRNIFTVKVLGEALCEALDNGGEHQLNELYECRIKGKVLKCDRDFYNPLAPGDIVCFEDSCGGKGLITAAEERRNIFTRLNRKERLPQILGANIDIAVCVTTPCSPPFRARFIDRVLVEAENAGIPPLLLVNKIDLFDSLEPPQKTNIKGRLDDYQRIGYDLLYISAKTGEGLNELAAALSQKSAMFIAQSGVGKSSIINALSLNTKQKTKQITGGLNKKYDRGNHTTAQAEFFQFEGEAGLMRIIDTPGVRQFTPFDVRAENLAFLMKDFALWTPLCAFGASCSHRDEPDCAVRLAASRGDIHSERYESYLRLRAALLKERPDNQKS